MEQVAVGLAVFLGGIVCGFAGFAFSAVAGAILLHVLEPLLAVPLMMICSTASQASTLVVLRRFTAWRETLPLLVGGAVGVPLAVHLLTIVEPHAFRIAFGIFLASYAGYMLLRPGIAVPAAAANPVTHSAVGFAGGFVGGLTAMPGALPVIWCDLRGISKEHQRGQVQPFILGMQVLAIVTLLLMPGAVHRDLLGNLLLALPALIAGTFIGMTLFGRVDDRRFRSVVLALLLVSGCAMVW